jgi:O-antigen/teichoic acid export membrane protein
MSSSERQFGGSLLGTGATNISLAALGVVTGVLGARLLGVEGRGGLAAIQTWPSLVATVAMIGLPEAVVYFSARQPDKAGRWLGTSMACALLTSVVFGLVGYLAMPFLLAAQTPSIIAAARWYLALGPIYALVRMPLYMFQGLGEFGIWNRLRMAPSVGWILVLGLAFALGRRRPDSVAVAYLGVLALLFVPMAILARRRIHNSLCPDLTAWPALLRYGSRSALADVPQLIRQHLDLLMMAMFVPAPALGLYAVSIAWGGAASPILEAVSVVVFPWVAASHHSEERSQRMLFGTRTALMLSLPVTGLLVAGAPIFVPLLFGESFRDAIPCAVLLSVSGVLSSVSKVVANGLRGLGEPQAILRAELTGLALFGAGLIFLLGPAGILGAALSSTVSNMMVAGLLVREAAQLTGKPMTSFLLPSLGTLGR